MKVGGGLQLMVEGQGERLVMQIGDRSIFEDGYYIFDSSVLRYIGRDISERARSWLEIVGDQLGRLHRDPEKSARWQAFLSWASVQPSRAFGVHGGEQTYQGEELLIRLLEPCQARCSFCICRSGQPDLVSSIDDVEERLVEGREHGMEIVVFTGGEPTLVRDQGPDPSSQANWATERWACKPMAFDSPIEHMRRNCGMLGSIEFYSHCIVIKQKPTKPSFKLRGVLTPALEGLEWPWRWGCM